MGRGRQKAKQTKVARRLKYESPQMDIEALQRELSGSTYRYDEPDYSELADKYADLAAEADEDDPYAPYAEYGQDFEAEDGRK